MKRRIYALFYRVFFDKILQNLQCKINLNIIVFFFNFLTFKIAQETITFFNYFILTQRESIQKVVITVHIYKKYTLSFLSFHDSFF